MARPATPRLALTATAATTMRGRTSLRAVRVWRVSWLMTIAPPTRTKSTKNASATPSAIRHSPPTRLCAVTSGVASRVWPRRVKTGFKASVTRERNQALMAASMWPVMSNSPGEVVEPLLTDPPLPGAGVDGVVAAEGPTWSGGGPSPGEVAPDDPPPDDPVAGEPLPVPVPDVAGLAVWLRAAASTTTAAPCRSLVRASWLGGWGRCPAVASARTAVAARAPASRCRWPRVARRRISRRRTARRGWRR
jgi:hypothetical protein